MGESIIIYGLKYKPSLGSGEKNDSDGRTEPRKISQHFSDNDHAVLKSALLSIKDTCNFILEVGIARKGRKSSTYTLLDNKRDQCIYLGVDLRAGTFLLNYTTNVYTLQTNSSNIEQICDYIKEISGRMVVDFLHIDGWHSVNQILDDWRFAEFVSDNGVIVLHDTNVHPGPVELVKAIDREIFFVEKYFEDRKDDWGITVVRKKI